MKFFAYIALICGAAAVKMGHRPQMSVLAKIKTLQGSMPPLTEEQAHELQQWAESELADGGTITKEEAEQMVKDFSAKHGFEITEEMHNELEMMFDMADTNGDGQLEASEIYREGPEGERSGSSLPPLTEAQQKELEEWIRAELEKDGDITKKEAKRGIKKFAKKHGIKLTKEMWKELEMMFEMIDTNGDGKVDIEEAERAFNGGGHPDGSSLPRLTPAQADELAAWAESELADGGTITKDEAQQWIMDFAARHGFELTEEMWQELEMMFEFADANGDGEIDGAEAAAAMGGHDGGDNGGSSLPQLNDEQLKELEDWARSELANEGTITKGEAEQMVKEFAMKHGFELTDEMWQELEMMFDWADANGDGEIDGAEAARAFGDGPHEESMMQMAARHKYKKI